MATVTLGNVKFNWKGPYNNSTAYVVDDVVSSGGSSYVCILASTGNAVTNGTYWQQMSAAGTDGTDVAATLANKEISFKTNAGALDGIPIGNAGEFLKVNSGATGYEFGAVSSDFVKIASGNTTANATIDIQGCFSTSYKFYKLLLTHNFSSTAYIEVGMLNASDNSHNSSTYYSFGGSHYSGNHSNNSRYNNSSGANTSIFAQSDSGGFRPINTWGNNKTDELSITEVIFANPIATTKTMVKMHSTWSQSGYVGVIHATGMHDSTNSLSGIRLQSNDGVQNFTTNGFYAVYGMKQ